jgi:hypothetical protein
VNISAHAAEAAMADHPARLPNGEWTLTSINIPERQVADTTIRKATARAGAFQNIRVATNVPKKVAADKASAISSRRLGGWGIAVSPRKTMTKTINDAATARTVDCL